MADGTMMDSTMPVCIFVGSLLSVPLTMVMDLMHRHLMVKAYDALSAADHVPEMTGEAWLDGPEDEWQPVGKHSNDRLLAHGALGRRCVYSSGTRNAANTLPGRSCCWHFGLRGKPPSSVRVDQASARSAPGYARCRIHCGCIVTGAYGERRSAMKLCIIGLGRMGGGLARQDMEKGS